MSHKNSLGQMLPPILAAGPIGVTGPTGDAGSNEFYTSKIFISNIVDGVEKGFYVDPQDLSILLSPEQKLQLQEDLKTVEMVKEL